MADTVAVLLSPHGAFRRLGERRPLLAPWVVVSLPSMALSLLVVSIAQRASVHLLETLDDPALLRSVAHQLDAMKIATIAVAPAMVWLRWSATAALLWAMATFLVRHAPYRTVLCVVACGSLPDIFARGVDLGVAWLDGPELTSNLLPVATSASSLATLLPGAHAPWVVALLDRLTPFSVWCVVLWVIGLEETLGTSARRALLIALPAWAMLAAGGAALAVLRGSLASLAPGLTG